MRHILLAGLTLAGLLWAIDTAAARSRMSFSPGSHGYSHGRHHGFRAHGGGGRHVGRGRRIRGSRRSADTANEGGAALKGSGFQMEDGILTYPAPARFQPKNLKHP